MTNNNIGWECPKCGMVHNPNVAFCMCSIKATCYELNVNMNEIEDAIKIASVFKDFGKSNIPFGGA